MGIDFQLFREIDFLTILGSLRHLFWLPFGLTFGHYTLPRLTLTTVCAHFSSPLKHEKITKNNRKKGSPRDPHNAVHRQGRSTSGVQGKHTCALESRCFAWGKPHFAKTQVCEAPRSYILFKYVASKELVQVIVHAT